jgi:hypothetical protein
MEAYFGDTLQKQPINKYRTSRIEDLVFEKKKKSLQARESSVLFHISKGYTSL